MKRILSTIIILTIIIACFIGCSRQVVKETSAENFEYEIYENAYVFIKRYNGTDKDVVIPKKIEDYPVKSIAATAFMSTDIESVLIPDTIVRINANAFANCTNLHTVKMGDSVTSIYNEAFRNCTSLKNVTLSSNLEELGVKAFRECSSLEEIYIPKTVTKWGMEAFSGCGLTKVTFEEGIKSIGSYACFWCGDSLKSVTFPKSVKQINEYSFSNGLQEAHFLGDAPESIGSKPFSEKTVIYYNKKTSGWDDTPLEEYTLIAE